jgi:hypothetical protein
LCQSRSRGFFFFLLPFVFISKRTLCVRRKSQLPFLIWSSVCLSFIPKGNICQRVVLGLGSSLHATMTTTKGVTLNTNCRRIKFARRFITTLMRMRKTRPSSSLSMEADVRKRSQRIKIAACYAMAHAVGPRRAWSRAVLFKLRSRARHQSMIRRRSFRLQKKRVVKNDNIPSGEVSQADKLRQLVPGGKAMDVCSLLEETAHYISCLATQVKVMQTIADRFSK